MALLAFTPAERHVREADDLVLVTFRSERIAAYERTTTQRPARAR